MIFGKLIRTKCLEDFSKTQFTLFLAKEKFVLNDRLKEVFAKKCIAHENAEKINFMVKKTKLGKSVIQLIYLYNNLI